MTCLRERLVADWATIAKFWSVRMNAIGVVLYPLLIAVQTMPPEVQAMFPVQYRAILAGIYSLASIAARVWPQQKLNG